MMVTNVSTCQYQVKICTCHLSSIVTGLSRSLEDVLWNKERGHVLKRVMHIYYQKCADFPAKSLV